jgi:sugar/nucleoside kinase (ribokinase family)
MTMPSAASPAADSRASDPGVLVVGDVMTDVIVKPEGPLFRGADRRATIRALPGGSAANQALWIAHFGIVATLAAKIGQADLPRCEALMRRGGVAPRLRGDRSAPTGVLVTIVDPDGQRSFFTDRGANDALNHDDLTDDLLDGVAVLHVSGYALVAPGPRAAVRDLMDRARRRGVALTVDPASASFLEEVGRFAFLEWTEGADICFPNADEAAILAGSRDEGCQRARLGERYALTVIKRGAQGAEVVSRGAQLARVWAPAVEAVDTTGAGDAFLAAYLAAHLVGVPPSECLARGVAAGSAATTFLGGQPAILSCLGNYMRGWELQGLSGWNKPFG